jgi:heat shock protein HslJ
VHRPAAREVNNDHDTGRRMIRFTWLAIVATAITMACTDNSIGPSDAVGGAWQLVSIQRNGSNPITVADPSRYTLQLDADGRVRVKSDCNSCGGSYTLSGSALQFSPLACTRAFCGEASLDSIYSQALDGTKTVSVNDSTLTLTGNGATLQFKR